MAKEKKISFSYSLYKRAKSKINEEGELEYPIYMKVTFNRTSTRFPLPEVFGNLVGPNTASENGLQSYVLSNSFKDYEHCYESILRHEYSKAEKDYSCVGINSRFKVYTSSILNLLGTQTEMSFKNALGDMLTFNRFMEVDSLLYENREFDLPVLKDYILEDYVPNFILDFNWLSENIEGFISSLTPNCKLLCHQAFEFLIFEKFYGDEYTFFPGGQLWIFDWIINLNLKKGLKEYLIEDRRKEALIQLKAKNDDWGIQIKKFGNHIGLLDEIKQDPIKFLKDLNERVESYLEINLELAK